MSESTVYSLDRELRKLKPAELYKLAQILCVQDSWKKLMAIIPKDDDSDLPKFNIEHIRYSLKYLNSVLLYYTRRKINQGFHLLS